MARRLLLKRADLTEGNNSQRRISMYNIFYIIGVIVVVLVILGYLGLA